MDKLTDPSSLRQNAANNNESPATNWKENLAYLSNYHTGTTRECNQIIGEMGDVLLEQRDISAAIVCYILSMNVT